MKIAVLISQGVVLIGICFVLYFMSAILIFIKKKRETDSEILEKLDSLLKKEEIK